MKNALIASRAAGRYKLSWPQGRVGDHPLPPGAVRLAITRTQGCAYTLP